MDFNKNLQTWNSLNVPLGTITLSIDTINSSITRLSPPHHPKRKKKEIFSTKSLCLLMRNLDIPYIIPLKCAGCHLGGRQQIITLLFFSQRKWYNSHGPQLKQIPQKNTINTLKRHIMKNKRKLRKNKKFQTFRRTGSKIKPGVPIDTWARK